MVMHKCQLTLWHFYQFYILWLKKWLYWFDININYLGLIEEELVEKGFSQEDAALMVRKQLIILLVASYVSRINWL